MMTALTALTAPMSTLIAAQAKKTGSNSTLLILVVIAAGFYFLILRPQQQKAKKQREVVNQFEVGDEVLTAGGIIGHVIDIEGDRITLETGMGTSFEVLRQYVIRKISVDVVTVDEKGDDNDGEHGGIEKGDDTEGEHGGDEKGDDTDGEHGGDENGGRGPKTST